MDKKPVPIVLAAIVRDKKVFMILRNDPKIPEVHEKWELPGGKIEYGEDPLDTLLREAKEETGLEVEAIRLLPEIFSNLYEYGGHAVMMIYECRIESGEVKLDSREGLEGKFFAKSEIDFENCLPKTKEIIDLLGI